MKCLMIILACLTCIGLQVELFFTPQMIAKHLETYSDQEIQLLDKDLKVVRSVCFEDAHDMEKRFYVATAGGPGARIESLLLLKDRKFHLLRAIS